MNDVELEAQIEGAVLSIIGGILQGVFNHHRK
jgi:hypothetical protein